jgi:saccharopine dehydrogenase-like NADP-dependent oxidoreductase
LSKVTVLGGCGAIGSEAVRTLAVGDDFAEVVIAEKRTELACELAEQLDPSRISVLKLDADDAERIKRAVACPPPSSTSTRMAIERAAS